jgi:hypothetical protein
LRWELLHAGFFRQLKNDYFFGWDSHDLLKHQSDVRIKFEAWLFASWISLRGSLLRFDSHAQFHVGANSIKKQKLLRKLFEPTLKIYIYEKEPHL